MNLFPVGTLSPDHIVGVRPEHIAVTAGDGCSTVDFVEPLGPETLVHVLYGSARLPVTVRVPGFASFKGGDKVSLAPDMNRAVVFER
jgi:ABC-type sugar transport system ATPase subunit